jgi:hypothetical protein
MSSSHTETPNRVVREDCQHLSDLQWKALLRMAESIGESAVGAMLLSLSHNEQHASIAQFMANKLEAARNDSASLRAQGSQFADDSRQQIAALREQVSQQSDLLRQKEQQTAASAARPRHIETLKVEVSKYRAVEGDSLLRWLVELDDAIVARRITDEAMRVTFAMSNLGGRAKAWALGLKLKDRNCFPTYGEFRDRLRQAFEPPKSEFRARSEFLELRQGKRDIHAYAQQARYLVSCIVQDPVDDQTQVVTYVKGLVDGPIKTHLFRSYPEDLERAIELSLEEEFSLRQAYVHSSSYRPAKRDESGDPEPMDLSVAVGSNDQPRDRGKRTCNRCKKLGHFAFECLAPRRVAASGGHRKPAQGSRPMRKQGGNRPKNGRGQ